MDAIRQSRFITPGLFFVGILVLGVLFEAPSRLQSLKDLQPAPVVAVIGAVLAAMFPLGFVIGAVTSLGLRAGFWICGRRSYQIELSESA